LYMQAAVSRWSRLEINQKEVSTSAYYYIGLDIHKKTISYCIKAIDGSLIGQGKVNADRRTNYSQH
jgi:hypothetical protein